MYIITYHDAVTQKNINDLTSVGAEIKYVYTIIHGVAAAMDDYAYHHTSYDPEVAYAGEEDILHITLAGSVPQINADQVHVQGITGTGSKVCIVDTGIDDTHPDLNPVVGWNDLVNGLPVPYDDNGHGTRVSGIVASTHPTITGVAPGASLMGAKVCNSAGSCTGSDIIAGIDWCVLAGADIISMSLATGVFATTPCDTVSFVMASNNAASAGLVVVASSGNNGDQTQLSAPACGSKVLSVGAVDNTDTLRTFSNGGPLLDVVAPGSRIRTTAPGGFFASFTGTSASAPHASALAALLLQTNPSLPESQVRSIIKSTAVDLGAPGFDFSYGDGRIDAFAAYNAVPQCTDIDMDGFFAQGGSCGPLDCDDSSTAINPNAVETCDGLDNNCNGLIDEVDNDFDGVNDCSVDICPGSVADNIVLNSNIYAQNNNVGPFEVGLQNDQSMVYNMLVTQGCSCKQIVAKLGVGQGHLKKGCSPSLMEDFTGISANPDKKAGIGKKPKKNGITGFTVIDNATTSSEKEPLGIIALIVSLVIFVNWYYKKSNKEKN